MRRSAISASVPQPTIGSPRLPRLSTMLPSYNALSIPVSTSDPWRSGVRACAIAALVLLGACTPEPADRNPASTQPAPGPDVVARRGVFELTLEAFDQHIVSLAASERPAPGTDLDVWYRERIRELVIEQALLQQARESSLDATPEFQLAQTNARRQLQLDLCLRSRLSALPPFERADLKAEFDSHIEQFSKPERRLTLHLFRRTTDAASQKAADQELQAYRDRVLNGESFDHLARAYSDSESRHRGGEIGWLVRGELPAAIDEVVFALDEGVPSTPVVTKDGLHLFFVQSVTPARVATLIEAMPTLRERLQLRRVESLLKPIIEADTRDFGMPDKDRFAAIIDGADAQSILLADGDFTLDLGTFRRLLKQLPDRASDGQRNAVPLNTAWSFLQALRTREKLRATCEREGWIDAKDLDSGVQSWARSQLISERRHDALLALAGADETRLREYYTQNIEQFSTPISWDLLRLQIPLDDRSTRTMAELERAAQAGTTSIEALQSRLGGTIEKLPAQNLSKLKSLAATLPTLISPLQPGQLSAPLRTAKYLEIFQLEARTESAAKAYEQVQKQVVRTFASHHAADLYRKFGDQLFAEQPLEIFPETLQRLVDAGLPEPDISPEALERLLEAL